MYRFWAAALVQLLLGLLAGASPNRGATNITKTNITETASSPIDSKVAGQPVELLSHAKEEVGWWRLADVANATVSEVLDLWNITHEDFHKQSQLYGNASALHIHAYLGSQEHLKDRPCDQITYQILDHGRLLHANYTAALEYGPIYGNMTGKGGSCANELLDMSQELAKRATLREFAYYGTVTYLTVQGIGGLYMLGWKQCEFDVIEDGRSVKKSRGTGECVVIAVFTTLSIFFGIALYLSNGLVHEAMRGAAFAGAHNVDVRHGRFTNIGHDQNNYYNIINNFHDKHVRDVGRDAWDEYTELLHGYHERNITLGELLSANSTHRTAIHWEDFNTGFKGPVEIWHEPHPHQQHALITRLGYHPELSAQGLKEAHEKRSVCSYNDSGSKLNDNWDAHWCDDGIGYNAPTSVYYGWETYNRDKMGQLQSDVGKGNIAYNGFASLVNDVSSFIIKQNSWNSCICFQTNGKWVATGALQFSWSAPYKGNSVCYKGKCGQGGHDEL